MTAHVDLSTLSDGQRDIATIFDRPLFVAAGAGSGKTFTLTQRIAWALAPGSGEDGRAYLDDISQVLVITFTNAAAREIKERVRSTLRQSGMADQALKVDSAWISTIHGMCSRILKRHALDLGIDPEFRIASGNEEDAFLYQALNEAVGEAQRKQKADPALQQLFDQYGFGTRSASGYTGVLDIVQRLRQAAIASPDGFEGLWIPPAADIASLMGEFTTLYGSLAGCKLSKTALPLVLSSLDALEAFGKLAPGARTAQEAKTTLAQVKMPRSSAGIKEFLPEVKEAFQELEREVELALMRPCAEAAIQIAQDADRRYGELKREHSLLDNDDLISQALWALQTMPDVAHDYEGRFKLVMVDEFQDTDAKQVKLISLLSGKDAEHLTTVGDSQQSIYRFRGADVSVFQKRGASLPKESRIQLQTNFRSHRDILSFVDAVCGGKAGVLADFMHLDPTDNEKKVQGHEKAYRAKELPRIDIELTRGESSISQMQTAAGAMAIAKRFRAYADAGELPGKMVLLLRAGTHADLYIDAIRKVGLECVVTGGSTFTQTAEAATMQALLHYLANDHDTQSGLFPLLSSPLFGLEADDFIELATTSQPRCDAPAKRQIERGFETMKLWGGTVPSARLSCAHGILARARQLARRLPVADVCTYVVKESGWLSRLATQGAEGQATSANVLAALRYIRDLTQDLGLGPARAASEFDRWLEVSKIPPASLSGGESSAVKIMTIHASKGLEFDVVAVAECWANPRGSSFVTGPVPQTDRRACILPPKDTKLKLPDEAPEDPKTLGAWYAALKEQDLTAEAEESARLLYVALTRAKEALILGLSVAEKKDGCLAPQLAAGVADALFEGNLPGPGTSRIAYGGTEDALVHTVTVRKEASEDGRKGFAIDSGGSVPEIEGDWADDPAALVASETGSGTPAAPSFDLFGGEEDVLGACTRMRRSREGVFSFSQAKDTMDAMAGASGLKAERVVSGRGRALPTRAERDAELEGAPVAADEDKATNLGSAFHLLAQSMVETGKYPDEGHIKAMEEHWRLSPRACSRLERALARWSSSSVRKEALSYAHLVPEMPFFSEAHSELGSQVEGAFDLVAWNDRSHALLIDYKTGDTTLGPEEIFSRHALQADLYARVLRDAGFADIDCRFVCVEVADGEHPDEPLVASYHYDGEHEPYLW